MGSDENPAHKPLEAKVSLGLTCGKEEIVEELRNCLPKWVTQEQVTDMIRGTWRNVVEIVDDFYEHETIFYDQVSAVISFTSRDGIGSGNTEALVSKLEFIHEREQTCPSSQQFHKLKSISSSQKSSISPVKRNRKVVGRSKKKGKASSKVEQPGGPKQASITKFFNKVP
ncbi:unnamed protein product [Microthlaspi erraticum]|uniref:Uncharacterized protein n=1 Tax=Microthlaspi erraticum TaxID=1685480 RepID=A0A6D2L9W0_9BRAS|nr:unnamed protein product [Microthlaspi erraticum]